jgi:hypothetical protein
MLLLLKEVKKGYEKQMKTKRRKVKSFFKNVFKKRRNKKSLKEVL